MTVDELIERLVALRDEGKGDYSVIVSYDDSAYSDSAGVEVDAELRTVEVY